MENCDRSERTEATAGAPRLVRFLAVHMALGVAVGVAVAALFVRLDVAGFKSVLATSDEPLFALSLLYFLFALTFGSLSMGIAVMSLPMDKPCDMRDPEDRDKDEDA